MNIGKVSKFLGVFLDIYEIVIKLVIILGKWVLHFFLPGYMNDGGYT